MLTALLKPASIEEAAALKRENPRRMYLAGGTQLFGPAGRSSAIEAVALEGVLGREIRRGQGGLEVEALASFQDLIDSAEVPALLRRAAAGMANRQIRNRATLGGNLGADKACSSLIPALLALDAELRCAERTIVVRDRPNARSAQLILSIFIPFRAGRKSAYLRWSRCALDLAVLSAAVSFSVESGRLTDLRIAAGGVSARAERLHALEELLENKPLPARAEIERLAASNLSPRSDQRGGAVFKTAREAQLIADALHEAYGREAES